MNNAILWDIKTQFVLHRRHIASFGKLRRVALVRTDDGEECIASIIRMTKIGELGTLAVTRNRSTMRRNTM
jgi:hypothetical protein